MVGSRRPGSGELVPDYLLNVRDDSHRVVGIVRQRYRIVQNSQAPAFLDPLIDAGEASYHAAGELHGGSQVWWLLRLAGDTPLGGVAGERLETFILLTNSHNGSTSLSAAVVGLRPRSLCTLVWPLRGIRRTLAVRHTDSAADGAPAARRILALALDYQAGLAAMAERMLQVPVNEDRFAAFVRTLIPARRRLRRDGRTVNQRGITMAEKANHLIARIYFEHEALADIRGTLWGAVQAAQFYADHETINRTTADASRGENRFKRLTSEPNLGSKAFANAARLLG
jgi:phage/plasmid-like protein (TIGR03299 family)